MILRVSSYLSQVFILFIALSILGILYLNFFSPSISMLSLLSVGNYNETKKLEYKISYLFSSSNFIFFYNYGEKKIIVDSVYLDSIGYYNGSIHILINNRWISSNQIPPHTIFRLRIDKFHLANVKSILIFTPEGVMRIYV